MVGKLVPDELVTDPELAPGANLLEVHKCLTVMLPWAGPCRVDVTWDPALVVHGLSGTVGWDGRSDMAVAVGETGPRLIGGPRWAQAGHGEFEGALIPHRRACRARQGVGEAVSAVR